LECDIWSCGVIAFSLLTGRFPFDYAKDEEDDEDIIMEKIITQKTLFEQDEKKFTSKKARKFCRALLKRKINDRLTAKKALKSSWITK
jgi:calcium-dependent protein kinase